jgi:hypothetical protein
METLLERETLCWDLLLTNIGAAVASSARRTADLGRSLGCEAAKEDSLLTEAPPIHAHLGLAHLTNATWKRNALKQISLWSLSWYDKYTGQFGSSY